MVSIILGLAFWVLAVGIVAIQRKAREVAEHHGIRWIAVPNLLALLLLLLGASMVANGISGG